MQLRIPQQENDFNYQNKTKNMCEQECNTHVVMDQNMFSQRLWHLFHTIDRFWNVFLFAFDGFAIIGPEFLPNQQVHQHRLQNTEFIAINTQHLGPFVNANLQSKSPNKKQNVRRGEQRKTKCIHDNAIKKITFYREIIYNNYHRQGDFRFAFYHICHSEHFPWCKHTWRITVLHNRSKRSFHLHFYHILSETF